MKRKLLRSEQGFTLVELMIVVVIMGILVAVAIPIYGGLTNRAERQTCHSNCEIIEKAAVQYLMTAGNDTLDDIAPLGNPVTVESQADAEAKFPPAFLACFEGGTFPECPSENCHYTISYNNDSGGRTVTVTCSEHGGKSDA